MADFPFAEKQTLYPITTAPSYLSTEKSSLAVAKCIVELQSFGHLPNT